MGKNEWTQVRGGRDPFARTTLMRRVVRSAEEGCAWCGQNNRHGSLFEYREEGDGCILRVQPQSTSFCSIGCWRTYHSE